MVLAVVVAVVDGTVRVPAQALALALALALVEGNGAPAAQVLGDVVGKTRPSSRRQCRGWRWPWQSWEKVSEEVWQWSVDRQGKKSKVTALNCMKCRNELHMGGLRGVYPLPVLCSVCNLVGLKGLWCRICSS